MNREKFNNSETMMYTESIRGYPYMQSEQIAEEFHISKGTVFNRLKGIEEEIKNGRYNDYAVIRDGKLVFINVLVFLDYLKHRKQLQDRNARKYTPEFQPEKIVQIIGWNNRIVREGETTV